MVKAIVVHEYGGPEVMKWEDVEIGAPGPGEARVKHAAIGLNFVDVYNRTGLYKPPGGLPFTPGSEGRGHGDRGRAGRHQRQARRPRRLCRAAGLLCRGAADPGRPADQAPRRRSTSAPRRR